MERRMVDQRERMAREFQEEVRRRQEQEERNQEQEKRNQEQEVTKEPKKSTTLVPNSPPVPALRDRIKKEEEDAREKEENKVIETETSKEVKTQRKDQDVVTEESRIKKEQTLDVVGKLVWADKIFLRSNSIK